VTGSWTASAKTALLLVVGIVVQTTLMPDLQFRGVRPDLMLLLALGAGLVGGPEQGAVGGFAAGFLTDLFLQSTPLGLAALTYCLIGFSVGALRVNFLPERRLLSPAVALVGTGCGVVLFTVIGAMVGQSQLTHGGLHHLARIAVIEAVLNAILSYPVIPLSRWASIGSRGSALVAQSSSSSPVLR
jgi:rod shape-determining protein MreD